MSTVPIRDDEYAVEEISYKDMLSLLELQEKNPTRPLQESNEAFKQRANNELSQRLSENANQSLPDWLLSQ